MKTTIRRAPQNPAIKLTTYLILSTYGFTSSFFPNSAQGIENINSNPNKMDQSKLTASPINCESTCSSMVSSGADHEKLGLSGGAAWSARDDQWCADHGFQTDASTQASPVPTATSISTPVNSDKCGNIPLTQAEHASATTNCSSIAAKEMHCIFKNSQVEDYCLAYQAAYDAVNYGKVSMYMDIAAIAVCTYACLNPQLGPLGQAACGAAGISAGAIEMTSTAAMNNSPTAQHINILRELASGAGAGAGVAYSAEKIRQGVSQESAAREAAKQTAAKEAVTDTAADSAEAKQGNTASKSKVAGAVDEKPGADKAACATAVVFTGLLALRIYDAIQAGKTKKNACSSIQTLVSSAATVSTATNNSAGARNSTSTVQSLLNAGGGGNTASSGSTGSSNLDSGNGNSNTTITQPCADNSALTCATTTSAALDNQILKNSSLEPVVAPLAQKMSNSRLIPPINDNTSAGQLVAAGISGSSSGPFVEGLISMANEVQRNPKDLQSLLPAGAIPMSGGGGGGSFGNAPAKSDPFSGLFGGSRSTAPVASTNSATFGSDRKVIDIWHSESRMTLFEIISTKMEVMSQRTR